VKPGLLLDTSAWFAALNTREEHHARAERYYQDAVADGRLALVTTNLVVAEMHALITRGQGATAGVRFLDQLAADPVHEVVWVNREQERRAIDRWLRPFGAQRFSLADAASFELMRDRGVQTAFTLDRHFKAAGFEVVP
jgi:predicted nucleic acid-binding protein